MEWREEGWVELKVVVVREGVSLGECDESEDSPDWLSSPALVGTRPCQASRYS